MLTIKHLCAHIYPNTCVKTTTFCLPNCTATLLKRNIIKRIGFGFTGDYMATGSCINHLMNLCLRKVSCTKEFIIYHIEGIPLEAWFANNGIDELKNIAFNLKMCYTYNMNVFNVEFAACSSDYTRPCVDVKLKECARRAFTRCFVVDTGKSVARTASIDRLRYMITEREVFRIEKCLLTDDFTDDYKVSFGLIRGYITRDVRFWLLNNARKCFVNYNTYNPYVLSTKYMR